MRKNTSKEAYRWYADVGRWRIGSRWASPPRAGQLRKDKAGRLLDASGRRVPASAVAPEPKRVRKPSKPGKAAKPPKTKPVRKTAKKRKTAKTPERTKPPKAAKPVKGLVWDGERWRRGGRFVKPPKASELVRDEEGAFWDSEGSRVPLAAIADIPLKLVKPRRIRMEKMRRGEVVVAKEFVSSTWTNKKPPREAGTILEGMIERHAKKGPFEPHDVPIYEHGLKFVGWERLSPGVIQRLEDIVGDKAVLKYQDTPLGTEVYIHMGNAPKDPGMARRSFDLLRDLSEWVYEELLDYWGDLDWFVWCETDEALYG